ncbi:MAG: hypothetical protein IBJ18_07255 [Phycisphaerales bacterium]|nr:hypothetical protein [Phycisphaerales bacterium]
MARSGEHYMPRPDGDFSAWAERFAAAITVFWDDNHLSKDDLDALNKALATWNDAYPAHTALRAAAAGARRAKDAARAELQQAIRPLANFVQSYPRTTNADRAELGIAIRPAKGTRSSAPGSRPLTLVRSEGRLTHTLRLVDEATPTRRARPRGVDRAEVFVALTPPGSPAPAPPPIGEPGGGDYRYIGSVTRGETTLNFEPAKGGLQAHYLSRWVSTGGTPGPWSATASATVAA